jgi:signal transduction histidine kinase
LTGIRGALTLFSDVQLNEDEKDTLTVAQLCCDQLLVIINDILDLSKIEANKLTIEESPFVLRTLIENSLEVVWVNAEAKGIELMADIDPMLPTNVIGDATRIRQILVNLLSNAVKFSFHGVVLVSVKAVEHDCDQGVDQQTTCNIQVSVKDEGIGISAEAQHEVSFKI